MKNVQKKTIQQLVNILNACFSAGYFPICFKKAIIKFIPKENKSTLNPLNYRPISLLEVPGKIYERIIQGRLNAFLNDNKIIKDRQHGFRPQKGTSTAITIIHETIANALANKRQVYVVLRDVAKAFDKVWFNGLKYKLTHLQLPTILEKTLCNFLDHRSVKIKIGEETSNEIQIQSGVPQGSVLSPTLYTLYTNDLPPAGPGCLDILYADDVTQIVTTQSKSKNMMKLKVEREIDRINKFEKKWKIRTNQDKFKLIPIAQRKTKSIVVNNREIEHSKEGKVLGLTIQTNGISGHTAKVKNKGNAVIANLRRFVNLTPKLKLTLIKTLLLPIIEYPVIPLCTTSLTQKRKLQIIVNKALRFVNFNEDDRPLTAEDLHLKYNINPLNITLHNKAQKIWETIKMTEPDHYQLLTGRFAYNHTWFPKSSYIIDSDDPQPIYTSH